MLSFRDRLPAIALLCIAAAGLSAGPASAQDQPPAGAPDQLGLVDRVIAVAGDSVILESEIALTIQDLEFRGAQLPAPGSPEREALVTDILDQLIDNSLMVQAAMRDSLIEIDPEEIENRMESTVEAIVTDNFGGDRDAFLGAIQGQGYTEASFQEAQRISIRKSLLVQAYQQSRAAQALTAPVSDAEILARFENQTRAPRPETFQFLTIYVEETPPDSAWAAAEEQALAVLRRIAQDGEDFAEVAREVSEDSASAANGGLMPQPITQRSPLVQEFRDAAFSLPEGIESVPIRSPYGYHIIRVDRIRGPERTVRHILIRPDQSPEDADRALARAGEALVRARAGEPFEELQEQYGDSIFADTLTFARPDFAQYPYFPPFLPVLDSAEAPAIVGPIEGPGQQPGTVAYSVVKLIEHRPEGPWTLEEIEERLRNELVTEKIRDIVVRQLRDRMHVDIRWGG